MNIFFEMEKAHTKNCFRYAAKAQGKYVDIQPFTGLWWK